MPRYEDIYEEESEDDEEGPERKRRREDEDEEDSLLPRKERWKRKREELLFTYYELSGIVLSSFGAVLIKFHDCLYPLLRVIKISSHLSFRIWFVSVPHDIRVSMEDV